MEFVKMMALLFLSVCGAIILGLFKDEAAAWLPSITARVVSIAVKRAPKGVRDQYSREWPSHISEYPGKLTQLIQAFGCLHAAGSLKEWTAARRSKYISASLIGLSGMLTGASGGTTLYCMSECDYLFYLSMFSFTAFCAAVVVRKSTRMLLIDLRRERDQTSD